MAQKGFFIDVSKCTGCRTCQVACSDLNNTPVGLHLRRVMEVEGGTWKKTPEGLWKQDVFAYYVSIGCNQCADPACVKVCPTKAHFKRAEDGLVVIDRAKCIGCGMCAKACPYGVPRLDEKAHKMLKCDGCVLVPPREKTQFALRAARNAQLSSVILRSCVASSARSMRSLRFRTVTIHIRVWSSKLRLTPNPAEPP